MSKKPLPSVTYEQVNKTKVASMRAMIVGDFDSGKTSLAVGAGLHENMRPLLVLDIDRRLSTLADVHNLSRVELPTIGHAERLVRDISQPRERWPKEIREARTFVLDSVTQFRDRVLQEFASENAANSDKRETEWLYEQRDYGYASNVVYNLIDKLIQTGNHVILLAHPKKDFDKDKDGVVSVKKVYPALNARLANLLGGMMNFIWYTRRPKPDQFKLLTLPRIPYQVKITNPLYVEELKRLTRVGSTAEQQAQNEGWVQIPYMPDGLPNTLPMLWDLYLEAINKETGN